ncbi:MAG: lipopolysaccharide biosynthesis protein, partial [Muribaculaceae bacterium]|nr:lipopolysaccharide biosynthesis protein [Muribaculaceae bacterium]
MPSADNKRIAKNTMFLYIRMLLSIGVNFYTVRVIWQVLGVDNYGIYNVVGGIVLMFAFLQNAMIASSQRFISFELGKGVTGNLQKVFSLSLTVHFLLALIILVLAETIGLWFLNYKMNIPTDRMMAANWVYQCSILAFCVSVISVPYSASIVAHEHMKAYGYFGIIDVVLRLLIVLALIVIPFDKLIVYAILVLCVSLIMRLINSLYCRRYFSSCHYKYYKDKHLIKDMLSFAGWSFIGNMGFSVRDQGLNILINLFFNVAVNAAKGVASQVG